MAALQVKQICMYFELADLPKINTKLDQGEQTYSNFSFSKVLVYIQKRMVSKPFTKYYDGKCCHRTCQRQRLTQIRPSPDDRSKGERKAQSQMQ